MIAFLNCINDESHDCVAFYGLNGGPRSLEHVRRRDTMNLSRVWVTLRASDYLFRLFSPVPLAGYALLFSPRLPTV